MRKLTWAGLAVWGLWRVLELLYRDEPRYGLGPVR